MTGKGANGSLPTAPRQLSFRDGEIPSLLNAGVTASPTAIWCDLPVVASMGEKAVTQSPTENPVEHGCIRLALANPRPNRLLSASHDCTDFRCCQTLLDGK